MANFLEKLGIIAKLIVGGGLFVLLFLSTLKVDMTYIDIDGDGFDETIYIHHGVAKVYADSVKLLETDHSWDVREFIVGDFTNNGQNELALYLWKRGNYGSSLPFWVKENDRSYKQHLFLYELDDKNGLKALWHSSNLPYINVKTELDDFGGDGKNEIRVLERTYDWDYKESIAIWQWDEWGFKNISREQL